MILSAHQPSYLPWLGLFYKISLCHVFCIFDTVQYERKGFDNRNRIKTSHGAQWLSVPVKQSGRRAQKCNEVEIIQNGWQRKHLRSIEQSYAKAEWFGRYFGELEGIILNPHITRLHELNEEILMFGLRELRMDRVVVRAQDHDFVGSKSDLVLDMCIKLGADAYIFGGEGKSYADVHVFESAGVTPSFLNFVGSEYPQMHGAFIPKMSFFGSSIQLWP